MNCNQISKVSDQNKVGYKPCARSPMRLQHHRRDAKNLGHTVARPVGAETGAAKFISDGGRCRTQATTTAKANRNIDATANTGANHRTQRCWHARPAWHHQATPQVTHPVTVAHRPLGTPGQSQAASPGPGDVARQATEYKSDPDSAVRRPRVDPLDCTHRESMWHARPRSARMTPNTQPLATAWTHSIAPAENGKSQFNKGQSPKGLV